MKKETKNKQPKREEICYLGESVDTFGAIRQKFKNKDGEYCHYKSLKGLWFGRSYFQVDNQMAVRPEAIPEEKQKVFPTEQEERDYEAQKEIVKHTRLKSRKALDLKKPHPDIVRAVALLKPFCRSMDFLTLSRFTDYLKNQLSKRK